jgi:PAS domain S-box-containing protein
MKWSIEKKIITAGFALALVIFSSVNAICYWSIIQHIEGEQWVRHAYEVQLDHKLLLSTLTDAERENEEQALLHQRSAAARHLHEMRLANFIGTSLNFSLLVLVYYLLWRANSKHQLAEEAQRKSEELHRLIVTSISDAVFITNSSGTFTYVCPNGDLIFGCDREQIERLGNIKHLLGENLFDENQLETCGEIQNIEREITDRFGRQHLLLVNVKRVCINGGTVLYTCRDITKRKQAEDALRVSEERFRVTLKNSPIIVFNQDTDLRYTWVYNLPSNFDAEAIVGKIDAELFESEDAQRLTAIKRLVLTTGVGTRQETFFTLNGEVRYCDFTVEPLRNPQGEILGITCAATDITPLKQTEKALRKSERLYRTLASNFPNGVVLLFDKDLRYTLAEGKGLAEIGLSKELLEGKTIWELFSPEICATLERPYRAALSGSTTVFEIPYANRIHLVHVLPVKNGNGEIFAGMVMSQDISVHKQVELALQQERNFVSTVLDTAGALILVTDLEGKIIHFNHACEQATGYSFEEVKDEPFWMFLATEDLESVKTVIEELRQGRYPNQHENYWIARDGSRKLISWSNTVLLNADGEIEYLIGSGIDISERKRTEEIRYALEQEKELRQLQLRFFSRVSHEFRTPVSSILLSAQSLEQYYERWSREKIIKNLHRIQGSAKAMIQLLEDILTINRAETSILEFSPRRLNLEKFSSNMVEQIQLFNSGRHRIILDFQGQCQEIYMDERLLHLILSNLLSNAIKYSPQGSTIHFSLLCDPENVILEIRDEGIGIPSEDIPHLFEPFHRGENVRNIPGTGLGITVVKKCLDLQKGKISLKSEVGVGTTVTVTIPHNKACWKLGARG